MASTVRKHILVMETIKGGLVIVRALAQHPDLNDPTTAILIGGQLAAGCLIEATNVRITPIQLDVTSDGSIRSPLRSFVASISTDLTYYSRVPDVYLGQAFDDLAEM
ncbi:hypothetical protein LTR70_009885 [Exophiala xenobiotica]|uniref:Uncharacterized protein n=1 Tax=Lithohypha guttulata TaxID=1690604 RepID=A0ABR0JW37_9EURO|nr:hypothetical protein LTR24_009776 [Lithohypha guttulata]KAK5309924.1 hypothetical protein LTR70_009885 [Exophiala xenobiotica]